MSQPFLKISFNKIILVGRSDIDVHTYKSIQFPIIGDGRDLFLWGWKWYLLTLSHAYRNLSFEGIPDYIYVDYEPVES